MVGLILGIIVLLLTNQENSAKNRLFYHTAARHCLLFLNSPCSLHEMYTRKNNLIFTRYIQFWLCSSQSTVEVSDKVLQQCPCYHKCRQCFRGCFWWLYCRHNSSSGYIRQVIICYVQYILILDKYILFLVWRYFIPCVSLRGWGVSSQMYYLLSNLVTKMKCI